MANQYLSQTPCHTGVLWKNVTEDEIILRTRNLQQIKLNTIGKDIFSKCNGKHTIAEINDFLTKRYTHLSENQIVYTTHSVLHYLQSVNALIINWEKF